MVGLRQGEGLAVEREERLERSWGAVLKNLVLSLLDVLRSEVELVRTELKQDAKDATHRLVEMAVFLAIAFLGALLVLASLVLVLGNILQQRYDLSALIIGVILLIPGLLFSIKAFQTIRGIKP